MTAFLRVYKSVHNTVWVNIKNCPEIVITILSAFDIFQSKGEYKYDENNSNSKPEIWFECPMDFLTFIKSELGIFFFQRLGVEQLIIEDGE